MKDDNGFVLRALVTPTESKKEATTRLNPSTTKNPTKVTVTASTASVTLFNKKQNTTDNSSAVSNTPKP